MKQLSDPMTETVMPPRQKLQPPPPRLPARTQPPTQEDIRRRAYELFERRNGADGSAILDWLQAERELNTNQPNTGHAGFG